MLIPDRVLFSRLTLKLEMCQNTNKIILKVCNSSRQALEKKDGVICKLQMGDCSPTPSYSEAFQ